MLSNFPVSDAPKRKRKKLTGKEIFQKVFSIVGAIAFFSMSGSAMIKMYTNALQSGQKPAAEEIPAEANPANALAARERGFELVLEREPDNQTALEGLVQTRLDMGHVEEAMPPLETLVSLNPERPDYQALLEQLKADTAAP